MDINRFKKLDHLYSYAGFVPNTHDSGDTKVALGITHRSNCFLRNAIIESSWTIIRKDPAMLMKFNEYKKRMHENEAIVRIGKHLLSRFSCILKTKKEYEIGVVQ